VCCALEAALSVVGNCGAGSKTLWVCPIRYEMASNGCVLSLHSSMQIAWLSIGLASWRFRKAWTHQGRRREDLKFSAAWTWPWGPLFVVRRLSQTSQANQSLIPTFKVFSVAILIVGKYDISFYFCIKLTPIIQCKATHLSFQSSKALSLFHSTLRSQSWL
jgi:amino acid permease